MNIIEFTKSVITNFPKIGVIAADVHIDYADDENKNYGLSPIGDTIVTTDILGNETRRHNFILYANYQSINDYDRINNSGVLLELQNYLENIANNQEISVETYTNGGTAIQKKGYIIEITAGNGMMYAIPNEHFLDLVRYQLQIGVIYTVTN